MNSEVYAAKIKISFPLQFFIQVHCILVDLWNYVRDNVPSPVAFVTNGKGCATRKFGPYANHKQYCERLRLIMIQHIGKSNF